MRSPVNRRYTLLPECRQLHAVPLCPFATIPAHDRTGHRVTVRLPTRLYMTLLHVKRLKRAHTYVFDKSMGTNDMAGGSESWGYNQFRIISDIGTWLVLIISAGQPSDSTDRHTSDQDRLFIRSQLRVA